MDTKLHYSKLDSTKKNVKVPKSGFFVDPENLLGETKPNLRKFVTFYFDYEDDYKLVVDRLGIKNRYFKEHPHMNTPKLLSLIKDSPDDQ